MSERNRKLLIAAIILLVIAFVLLLLSTFFGKKKAPAQAPAPAPSAELPGPAPALAPVAANPLTPAPAPTPAPKAAAIQLAEAFAQRYGSYSNQGNFQNLTDLLPIMTARYQSETQTMLAKSSNPIPATTYEGVTSVKVSSKADSYDEKAGKATISVVLQQTKVGKTASVSYRTLVMNLLRLGDEWKVDKAVWQ